MKTFKVRPEDYPYNVVDSISHRIFEVKDSKHFDLSKSGLHRFRIFGDLRRSSLSKESLIELTERFVCESGRDVERNLKLFRLRFKDGLTFSEIEQRTGVSNTGIQYSLYKV